MEQLTYSEERSMVFRNTVLAVVWFFATAVTIYSANWLSSVSEREFSVKSKNDKLIQYKQFYDWSFDTAWVLQSKAKIRAAWLVISDPFNSNYVEYYINDVLKRNSLQIVASQEWGPNITEFHFWWANRWINSWSNIIKLKVVATDKNQLFGAMNEFNKAWVLTNKTKTSRDDWIRTAEIELEFSVQDG